MGYRKEYAGRFFLPKKHSGFGTILRVTANAHIPMPLADVIFPAPSAVYFSTFFIPLATILALATEFFVFVRMQQGVTSAGKLFGVVLAINIMSWIVGLLISGFLPTGLIPTLVSDGVSIIQPGPRWSTLAFLSFPFACIVSTLVEYFGLLLFPRLSFRSPFRTAAIANGASYIVLGATVFLFLHFSWI